MGLYCTIHKCHIPWDTAIQLLHRLGPTEFEVPTSRTRLKSNRERRSRPRFSITTFSREHKQEYDCMTEQFEYPRKSLWIFYGTSFFYERARAPNFSVSLQNILISVVAYPVSVSTCRWPRKLKLAEGAVAVCEHLDNNYKLDLSPQKANTWILSF